FGRLQLARAARDLLVGGAQLARGLTALALQPAAIRGNLAQLLAHAFEPALGVAAGLPPCRHRRAGGEQQRRPRLQRACRVRHPLATSRLAPVISAGLSTPSRSRMVGARSRRAPPPRRLALRLPT